MMKKIPFLLCMLACTGLFAQKYTDSLLLHVPSNATVADNGPYAFNVSPAGVAYTADSRGIANQAVLCNGTSTRVSYITNNSRFQHALPLTCAVWVNLANITGSNPVFYTADQYSVYAGIWIQIIDGYVYANVGDGVTNGSGNRYSVKSSVKFTAATWYHLCVVYKSATSIELYINGVKDAGTTASGGATTMGWNAAANASYGSANTGVATFAYLNGSLDNLMFWGRALNDAEIKMTKDAIYYGEIGYNLKDFGPTGTVPTKTGTTSDFDRLGNAGGGLFFNGSADKLALNASAAYKPSVPFTMSAWVFTGSSAGIMPVIATTDHNSSAYFGSTLWIENGYPTMYIGDGTCKGSTCRVTYASADSIKTRQWNMVTAVVTSLSNIKLYINGQPVSSGVLSGQGTAMNNSAAIAGNIGYLTDAYSISNKYFAGNMDEVFVLNNTLSAAEVASLYSQSVYVKVQPVGTTTTAGTTVNLNCKGVGTAVVTYIWQKMKWGTGWINMPSKTLENLDFPSLANADTGYYRCVVSAGGKNANSNAVWVQYSPVSGVDLFKKQLQIFPNPANTNLHLELEGAGKTQVSIFNLNGKLMLKKEILQGKGVLDISAIPAGNYIVKCASEFETLESKLTVVR